MRLPNPQNRGNLTRNQGEDHVSVLPERSSGINIHKLVQDEKNNGTTYVQEEYVSREIATDKTEDAPLMSVDELKAYEGFEDMNEAEAKEYIYAMQQFCTLTFELFKQENP